MQSEDLTSKYSLHFHSDRFIFQNPTEQINSLNIFLRLFTPDMEQAEEDFEWVQVNRKDYTKEPVNAEMLRELIKKYVETNTLCESSIFEIAQRVNYTTGMWMIFGSLDSIQKWWKLLAVEIHNAKLSPEIYGVSVGLKNGSSINSVICVYTKNFTNRLNTLKVGQEIRQLCRIEDKLLYKPNIYSSLGIYKDNSWGIRPSIYILKPERSFSEVLLQDEKIFYTIQSAIASLSNETYSISRENIIKLSIQDQMQMNCVIE